jgi:hypothetical protein
MVRRHACQHSQQRLQLARLVAQQGTHCCVRNVVQVLYLSVVMMAQRVLLITLAAALLVCCSSSLRGASARQVLPSASLVVRDDALPTPVRVRYSELLERRGNQRRVQESSLSVRIREVSDSGAETRRLVVSSAEQQSTPVISVQSYTTLRSPATIGVAVDVMAIGRYWFNGESEESEDPTSPSDPFPVRVQLMWQAAGNMREQSRLRTDNQFTDRGDPTNSRKESMTEAEASYGATSGVARLVVTQTSPQQQVLFNGTVACGSGEASCTFNIGQRAVREQ